MCFRRRVDHDSCVYTEILMPCPLTVAPCDVFCHPILDVEAWAFCVDAVCVWLQLDDMLRVKSISVSVPVIIDDIAALF